MAARSSICREGEGLIRVKDKRWTYGLFVDALGSVVGGGSGHLLGGKGLGDLRHFGCRVWLIE